LRPERVPVNITGGARFSGESTTLEVRGFFEKAQNTPVVVAVDTTGTLQYQHVDSRTIGAEAIARMQFSPRLSAEADLTVHSAVEETSGAELPMTSALDLRARADYGITDALGVFGAATFQSEQHTTLEGTNVPADLRTISARILLSAGASYRFMPSIEAFAEITNFLGYHYDLWQRYSAPGFEGRIGVRMKL
jgi:outer membrane cobalamin receptor